MTSNRYGRGSSYIGCLQANRSMRRTAVPRSALVGSIGKSGGQVNAPALVPEMLLPIVFGGSCLHKNCTF